MPELPEVKAHAERLTASRAGVEFERFEPLKFTVLKTAQPAPSDAYGRVVDQVSQRGKLLLIGLGDLTFVVHLMQGGRLRIDTARSKKPRGGQARWQFADEVDLVLTEAGHERKAGVWVVAGDPEGQIPLAHLGPDATEVEPSELLERLHQKRRRLHGFLRDQRQIAGLGRRLANEICHRARLSPFASTTSLDEADVATLLDAINGAVDEGLAFERARDDMSSSADRPGNVHHRSGQKCPVCEDTIREVEYRSHTVHYCPTCQTNGKVLADNTTSRFLK